MTSATAIDTNGTNTIKLIFMPAHFPRYARDLRSGRHLDAMIAYGVVVLYSDITYNNVSSEHQDQDWDRRRTR